MSSIVSPIRSPRRCDISIPRERVVSWLMELISGKVARYGSITTLGDISDSSCGINGMEASRISDSEISVSIGSRRLGQVPESVFSSTVPVPRTPAPFFSPSAKPDIIKSFVRANSQPVCTEAWTSRKNILDEGPATPLNGSLCCRSRQVYTYLTVPPRILRGIQL